MACYRHVEHLDGLALGPCAVGTEGVCYWALLPHLPKWISVGLSFLGTAGGAGFVYGGLLSLSLSGKHGAGELPAFSALWAQSQR